MSRIALDPIGIVRGNPSDDQQVIEVYLQHRDGLHRIEELDELWVLFWLHQLGEAGRSTYRVHPRAAMAADRYTESLPCTARCGPIPSE